MANFLNTVKESSAGLNNFFDALSGKSNALTREEIGRIGGNQRTGYSSLISGNLRLDPSIRRLENQGLATLNTDRGLLSSTLQNRNDLLGNRNQFIRARTNPLREAIARRKGGLAKELGRTGVRGTFAQQSKSNLALDSARQLQDAEAMALNEALTTEAGYTQLANQLNTGIRDSLIGVSKARTLREFEGLGLSLDQAKTLLNAHTQNAMLQDQARQQGGVLMDRALKNLSQGIGSGISGGMSDRRLKKNIKKIGELEGHNIYSYTYRWNEDAVGVMADEVEHIPGIVNETNLGMKWVNYSKLFNIKGDSISSQILERMK